LRFLLRCCCDVTSQHRLIHQQLLLMGCNVLQPTTRRAVTASLLERRFLDAMAQPPRTVFTAASCRSCGQISCWTISADWWPIGDVQFEQCQASALHHIRKRSRKHQTHQIFFGTTAPSRVFPCANESNSMCCSSASARIPKASRGSVNGGCYRFS
jgi:hypothetical protein